MANEFRVAEALKKRRSEATDLASLITRHEGLVKGQTPFRITDPSMAKWTSMFDDTLRSPLDPKAKKPKGREKFLFVPEEHEEDVPGMVQEQMRRYSARNPKWNLQQGIEKFDQTGAAGKLKFLGKEGHPGKRPLSYYFPKNNG